MSVPVPETTANVIRPLQYRDLEAIASLLSEHSQGNQYQRRDSLEKRLEQVKSWYGLFKFLSLFPNPFQHHFCVYVAESEVTQGVASELRGAIQVSPFNSSRSTWRVERVLVNQNNSQLELLTEPKGIGSQLLRHCFETIWEARTWLLEVNIHEKNTLALYRQHGFQPLAEMTYWSFSPNLLQDLAQQVVDLPNLLPVNNADAPLLYQLDCVSMPPLLRQVFDRHVQDFKTSFLQILATKFFSWCHQSEILRAYVFEPQRKAAIGYFELDVCRDGDRPHQAKLTVHPAYTWLYPNLLAKMAQIVRNFPSQSLELRSADYQPEREEFLVQLGAQRIEHTLLMSRSVWHKLREAKLERLQLAEMLQGLQAVPRTSIPSRLSLFDFSSDSSPADKDDNKDKIDNGKQEQ